MKNSRPHRNTHCRIRDYVWRGHRCISMENEILRAVFCADKGSDLLELTYKPTDTELMWQSARGLADVHDAPSSPLSSGQFRDLFPGGWYVMLPNGPKPCQHRGAEYGFHGEATFLRWDVNIEEDTPESITVVFSTRLRRTPVHMERRISLSKGSGTLVFDETISSDAAQSVEVLYGHHPCFGAPFLEPGCKLFLPPCRATIGDLAPESSRYQPRQIAQWPMLKGLKNEMIDASILPGPESNSNEFIVLDEFSDSWAALVNPNRDLGFALRWDAKVFPIFGFWQVLGGGDDYPWYGSEYIVALEPACALPSLAEAVQDGTAIVLQPQTSLSTRLEATLFTDVRHVSAVKPEGVIVR